MKKIAVATDLSERSGIALDRAAVIAAGTGADLSLVHAIDDSFPKHIVDRRVAEAEDVLPNRPLR